MDGPSILLSTNSETPTSKVATPGHTPAVVNVSVFRPSSAKSAKKNPVFALMQSPQLAVQVPYGGEALKSKFSSSQNASSAEVKTGEGVALINISLSLTSAKQVPSKTCVTCNQPLPAMPGSMVRASSSKHPSQSTSHWPEPSVGDKTKGSPPLHMGDSQLKPASTSLTAVIIKSSDTTCT